MFTITMKGKTSALNTRYPNARDALKAYHELAEDGAKELSITDNRDHQGIDIARLEEFAESENRNSTDP